MAKDKGRVTDPNLPTYEAGTTMYWLSPQRIRGLSPKALAGVIGGVLVVCFGAQLLYSARPSLEVAAPAGYCALDPDNAADQRQLASVESRLAEINDRRAEFRNVGEPNAIEDIDVLAVYADCLQLDAFRQSLSAPPDLVMAVVATRIVVDDLPLDVSRQDLLDGWDDAFAGQVGNQLIRDAVDITGALSDAPTVGYAPAGAPSAVSELRRDVFGLYRGRQNWIDAGPEPALVAVTGITVIEGSLVLSTILSGPRSLPFEKMFADVQDATEALIRMNEDL